LYAQLRQHLGGEVFRKLASQKESRVEEGHLMHDHVHMILAIPPKYAVSQVVGFIKGALPPSSVALGSRVRW
jgi:putative transposase